MSDSYKKNINVKFLFFFYNFWVVSKLMLIVENQLVRSWDWRDNNLSHKIMTFMSIFYCIRVSQITKPGFKKFLDLKSRFHMAEFSKLLTNFFLGVQLYKNQSLYCHVIGYNNYFNKSVNWKFFRLIKKFQFWSFWSSLE